MIWKVLRPDYWILDRKIRTSNRLLIPGLIFLFAFGGQWVFTQLKDLSVSPDQTSTFFASLIPFGLFVLLLFTLLSVGDIIALLFFAPDMELLMVAPVSYRVIFFIKLLQSSRASLIPAFLFMISLLMMGVIWGLPYSYYLLIILFTMAEVAIITAVVMSIVILSARIFPPQKVRSWIPVMVFLITIGLAMGQQYIAEWLLSQISVIALLAESLFNTKKLVVLVFILLGVAVIISLASYQIFRRAFYEGWNRFHIVPTQKVIKPTFTLRLKGLPHLIQRVRPQTGYLLVKEWKQLKRDPQGLMGLALPVVYLLMIVGPLMSIKSGDQIWQPVAFWYMLIFSSFLLTTLPLGIPLLSITGEGRNISLLRSIPISMSTVLKGKLWASEIPLLIAWILVISAIGIWQKFPLWQVVFLLGTILLGLFSTSLATMGIGAIKVDFFEESVKKRISWDTSFLIIGINIFIILVIIASATWLMVRFYPESNIVNTIGILKDIRPVALFFSEDVLLPLILFGSQVIIFVVLHLLWSAAVRRLEGYQAAA